ncbi:uncharacterized protein KZ484_026756 [Pholidichthys leucotaenia]
MRMTEISALREKLRGLEGNSGRKLKVRHPRSLPRDPIPVTRPAQEFTPPKCHSRRRRTSAGIPSAKPQREPRPDPVPGSRMNSVSQPAVASASHQRCKTAVSSGLYVPRPWTASAASPSSSTLSPAAVSSKSPTPAVPVPVPVHAAPPRLLRGPSVTIERGKGRTKPATAGTIDPLEERQVQFHSSPPYCDLPCLTPGGGVQGSQSPELPLPAVVCNYEPDTSVSSSPERFLVPGIHRRTRKEPAALESLVPAPQPQHGQRRRADCQLEPVPTSKRPRVFTEKQSDPAGHGSPATTQCGPLAWTSASGNLQTVETIMPAAEPAAVK